MNQQAIENLPVEALRGLCLDLAGEVERLQDLLALAHRRRFAASSEQLLHPGMRLLFPEQVKAIEDEAAASKDEEVEVKSYKRRGGRRRFPEALPREDIPLDLPESDRVCDCCGHREWLKKISERFSEKLHYQPALYKVIRYIRSIYSCSKCETIKAAPLPPHPLPKTSVTTETLAQIAVSKYMDALPLYRQSEIFARHGIDISRDKMARWMIGIALLCRPLVDRLHLRLLSGNLVQMDETGFQVLSEPGRDATSKSYMIVQARGDPQGKTIVIFHYETSRSKVTVKELLGNFKGTLLTDGLKVYASLCLAEEGLVAAGCWMHARRRFIDAQKATKKRRRGSVCARMLGLIDGLFKIESDVKTASADKRLEARARRSAPILEKIKVLIDENIGLYPKDSLMGDALGYARNQWGPLNAFLANGTIEIHNGLVENFIRPFAVGRRNWLFAESTDGADASATLYSLLVTAKANGINPYQYLCRILSELPKIQRSEDYDALLPFRI